MLNRKGLQKSLFIVLIIIAMALTGCANTASNGNNSQRTVKIGYLPITHALPLFIEDDLEKQGYKNFKLELVKFGSWPDLIDALNAGRIDGASMLVTLAMRAKEQGIGLKAVALGHRDGNVLVVSKDINQTTDLRGKSFAIPHKFSTHNILLYDALQKAGMKYEDVKAVELPPAEMPAALSEGRIAGYVVAEPFGAIAVAMDKGKVLFQSEELWKDSVDCALVLRDEFIEKERDVAQEFVNEYVKAGQKAEAKDDYAREVSAKYMKVEKDVLDLSLQWISYDNLRLNEEAYNKLTHYLKEMGLSQNPPTYKDFVDNSLIDEAK
jgi:NitT/TauT family transport system substrate-binding protein